ncbi:MAG: hypothetical protein JOZ83_15205 [Silvibacterium sp.]|nr:hypothetical protein [Silvibacterium sp.]
MASRQKLLLRCVYFLATVQFAWCYFWLTRPYVSTCLYELGRERMPFQGRMLMMLPMRLAHASFMLHLLARPFALSRFWFPRLVQPEVLMQAAINVVSLMAAGWFTMKIYRASSPRRLLEPFVYPLLLVACAGTYVLHTVQNFRFIYDLPSLAFFSAAMYLIYFRKPFAWFAMVFLVATINRETTLLLLPLYLIDQAVDDGQIDWPRAIAPATLGRVLPLAAFWITWQMFVHHLFAHNPSEFYPRLNWNIKSLLAPYAWPQLLSASGYLLIFVVAYRKRISDPQLRAWFLIVPIWCLFMFVYGILIETRVFGELIPFLVCASALISEQMLATRMSRVISFEENPTALGIQKKAA